MHRLLVPGSEWCCGGHQANAAKTSHKPKLVCASLGVTVLTHTL